MTKYMNPEKLVSLTVFIKTIARDNVDNMAQLYLTPIQSKMCSSDRQKKY